MDPNQNQPGNITPGPANQYDFITNPAPNQPPPGQQGPLSILNNNPFLKKVVLIVGGGIALMLLLWIAGSMLGSRSNANIDNAVGITQSQAEIIRVADIGERDGNQQTRNFAVTAGLSLTTQQQRWLALLAEQGHAIGSDELAASRNAETDQQLETAKINNAFDHTFSQLMEDALHAYAAELDSAYAAASHAVERELLTEHFAQTELLLEQLPD